ncbi:MAG: sigma-70 family RNA polymerase sigma factor [Planctomycetia bacterium]|nr:sigma-70 family RNA polymerase sigma factor [Planctomycetia bacterium]
MTRKLRDRPSDFVLIRNTRDYFVASVKDVVKDPNLVAAWRKFYAWYVPLIRRFAVSCGIHGEALEDVVQTAWEVVIRDLRGFDCDPSKGKFRAWLFLRVRSVSVAQVRQVKRRREQCAGVDFDEHESPDPEPYEAYESQWNEIVLQDLLNLLERYVSEFDYKLYIMRRFHEVSIAELAEDTGLCECTIRSKLHRTSRTIATLVQERGYQELLF